MEHGWEEAGTARKMPVSAMPWGHFPTAVGTALCGSSLGPLVTVSLAPSTLPQQAIEKLVALLNTLDRWIDETPPVDQPSRFGNKAYRTWYAKLEEVRLPQTGVGAGLGWAGRSFPAYQNHWDLCPRRLPGITMWVHSLLHRAVQ